MRYVSHLACSVCGASYPADRPMNLCPVDDRPVQMHLDLDRLRAERGAAGWYRPDRKSLWRFGGLLPLDPDDPDDRRVNRLHLTDEARRAHAARWSIAEATVDDALAPLSAAEREQYTRMTERVKGRLQALAGSEP